MQYEPLEDEITQTDQLRFQKKYILGPEFKTPEGIISNCWLWIAANKTVYGQNKYGCFYLNGRTVSAHRFSYYLAYGIDPGPSTDHLCHVTLCVNPIHLRGCSIAENNLNRIPVIREFCKNGHLRTADNIYTNPGTGQRQCRECLQERDRVRYAKKTGKEYTPSYPGLPSTAEPGLTPNQVTYRLRKYQRDQRKDLKDMCKYGHGFTLENTRINKKGARECRQCDKRRNEMKREYKNEWRRQKKMGEKG